MPGAGWFGLPELAAAVFAAGLLAMGRHHDEIPDAAFLEWLQGQLAHLIGLGPWTVVVVVGALVVAMPLGLLVFYWRWGRG